MSMRALGKRWWPLGNGHRGHVCGCPKKTPQKGKREKGKRRGLYNFHLIKSPHWKSLQKMLKFSCILLQVTHELWFLNFTHGKLGCLLSFPLWSFLLHDAHAFGQLSLDTLPGHLSIKHFQHLFPFLDLFAGSNLTLLHHLQLHLASASFWMVLDEG